jgi:hypothetical protein
MNMLLLCFVCLIYITSFPKYQKYLAHFLVFFTIGGLLIAPRVIDYMTEQKLIEKGYTYCEAERIGSVRHIKRTWQLDPVCKKKKKSLFY